jgi:signal transduction histidine kinase
VVLSVLAVWLAHTLRMQQMASGLNARFDERLAERMRMARDLRDTLLQIVRGNKVAVKHHGRDVHAPHVGAAFGTRQVACAPLFSREVRRATAYIRTTDRCSPKCLLFQAKLQTATTQWVTIRTRLGSLRKPGRR